MLNCNFYNPSILYANIKKGRIKVNGIGVVKTQPNIAIISLGVVTENKNLEVAQGENAEISTKVINGLKDMGIPNKDISTKNYTIEPQYDYVEGKQIFRGYKVTNILNVTIRDINRVGEIIDTSVKNGVNVIDNIKFTIDNMSTYYSKALNLAVKDAMRKAVEIGNTLKVNVNEIPTSIVEESYEEIIPQATMVKMYSSSTPIMPGEINITAKIESIFNYSSYMY
ncbi:SIMPL domain-containing protein [Clostridium lundense]|uniref:SIMPL domain-containing protein n=1 Tax=Clostridium lundense TaxID=319475 RepID=UPI00054E9579|nr:SIMPL domain-containing protein [Clostridium lundense]